MSRPPLEDKRVAILATHGFESEQLEIPLAELRRAGAHVDVVAPEPGRIRGWTGGQWNGSVAVDRELAAVSPELYDGLVLPGGLMSPDALRTDAAAVDFVRGFVLAEKTVAAICHAPWLLIEAGVVRGREVTGWPSLQTDLTHAGARWRDSEVVLDGRLLTSRRPDDLHSFCAALVDLLSAPEATSTTQRVH
jgi:protease I